MRIDAELFDLCKEYIKENKIESAEDIFKNEDLACELVEQICDLIGYYDYEEEEFEEE